MKLYRNQDGRNGIGKFALIRMDKLPTYKPETPAKPSAHAVGAALGILEAAGLVEHGQPNTENEFFVLKLKDVNAREALESYASAAWLTDKELSREVDALSDRAGNKSKWCKRPD